MNIDELKSLLSRFRIKPDKRLGQNFLLSEKVLDDIIAAAELNSNDTVLEIGPGLGILTRALGKRAGQVIAIEKDRKLVAALRKIFKNQRNVKIINDDALFIDPKTYNLQANSYKLVANIPYYLTGKLLQNFLTYNANYANGDANDTNSSLGSHEGSRSSYCRPTHMVLLLQKEVAERIVAPPGDMSVLAVSVQFYSDPEIISFVGKENFYPQPEVDSAVVKLKVLKEPRFAADEKKFFQMVKIGFANKRKMLKNNLAAIYNANYANRDANAANSSQSSHVSSSGSHSIQNILSDIGLNPLCRAQDLSLQNWVDLYHKVCYN